MPSRRRTHRKDANHNQIAKVFERAGCTVVDTSSMGGGFPDMIVARRGRTVVVEVKSRSKPSDDQKDFAIWWRGAHAFVYSDDEALDVITRLL